MTKKKEEKQSRPASTPEAREQQLVALAVDLAEKQLRAGTAASSTINHFLKIASSRESLEREMMEKQARLYDAKAQNIAKEKEGEEAAKKAFDALKNYNNSGSK